jgi:hypothetical protein
MISETTFSRGYSSFWQEYFPWLNNFTQVINRDLTTRVFRPIGKSEDAVFRSINNIVSFTHFKNIRKKKTYSLTSSFEEAKSVIANFPRNNLSSYEMINMHKEIIEFQVHKLIVRYGSNCEVYPVFPGCGILNSCSGDIYKDNTLIEVKAGERGILPSDLKQLISYAALNWLNSGSNYIINKIEVFNPRQGLVWNNDLYTFISAVSDIPLEDVFDQLCKYLIDLSDEIPI